MNGRYKFLSYLIPTLLLLWNPVVLWLYFKSMVIAFIITITVIIVGIIVALQRSFRLKVWLFNLAAICSILFQSEVIFTKVYENKNIPNLYSLSESYYFNKPFLDQTFNDVEFVSRYRTNSQGYRIDNLTQPDYELKECDWMFIGDSFTQGAQVDYQDLFSTLLYKSNPDKVIVNAGISGAGIYEELNYFKDKGAFLKPKVVFLQIGSFNDFMNVRPRKANFQDYLMEYSNLYRFVEYNLNSSDVLPLGRWTEPFFPDREDNITSNIFFKETCEAKERDKQNFAKCIREFNHEVQINGGKLVLFLIPSKEQISSQLLSDVLSSYNIDVNEIDLDAPSKLCNQIAESNSITFFDLTSDFKSSNDFPFYMHDEHMNEVGHSIVANRLNKEMSQNDKPIYFSRGNNNDRYPTIYNDGTLLFQSQDENHYYLYSYDLNNGSTNELRKSISELIHPIYTKDKRFLAYTEGDQQHSETDVLLYDCTSKTQWKLNKDGNYAAIPMFSPDASMIAFPEWKENTKIPFITIINLEKRDTLSFSDGQECWRPVFSNDNKLLYYIQKESETSQFVIKCYDIAKNHKELVLSRPYDIWDIALSPSGRYIVYAGNKDDNWDLFTLDLITQETKQLTYTLGNEWDPSFGLNDSTIWYAGVFGYNNGIYMKTLK